MTHLSSKVYRFGGAVTADPVVYSSHFSILDDIFAMIVFAAFSGIQAQLLIRLRGHLRNGGFKLPSRASLWFGIAHVVLGAGYLICAIFALVNFIRKLFLISQHSLFVGIAGEVSCTSRYSHSYWHLGVCYHDEWFVERLLGVLFPLVVLLSDGLLLFRCCILFKQPWANVVMGASVLRLYWFIFVACTNPSGHFSLLATIYASLLTTLLTSSAVVVWLWREELKSKYSMGTQAPYLESMGIIAKAALPPILLAFVHIGFFAGLQLVSVGFNALWLSFTVLASQTIAVSVFKQGHHSVLNGKPGGEIWLG
ncbi:hypothetical protein BKA70DRAFT_1280307 [Coprinopsis sp. MPI-PUGE-AT-0042]|nr:hypothetical protein BKA70DRAFT_1280307 [Coprinopsis sp. MPI-PUGE-AT-0042]